MRIAPPALFIGLLAAAALVAIAGPGGAPDAAAGPSQPSLSAEWKFVDEADDAAAAKILEPLLKKYDAPKKCDDLVKMLRGKRPYPTGLPDQATLEHKCLDGKSRQFTYILPRKMNPHKPTGVLVFLHGAVSQPPPGGGAGEARMFAPAVESLGLIVVGPSTYEKAWWSEAACREHVRYALEHVKRSFNVDENRVYLAGDSDGGRGAFTVPETEATSLAAVVPVIGSANEVTRFANLRNLPWLVFNGEKDTTFPVEHVRPDLDAMKAAGFEITWHVMKDVGHEPRLFLTQKDEICEFLAKHPRDPLPKVVHLEVDTSKEGYERGFPANTMRWVRIESTGTAEHEATFDDGAPYRGGTSRVRARREGNVVTLETRGVKTLTVLVSDAMLDLTKEVEVRTNGRLSFKGKVENDARAILEEARKFKDRALVFNARIAVDVDAPEPDAPAAK